MLFSGLFLNRFLLALIVALLSLSTITVVNAQAKTLAGIVATVNDAPITANDLDERVKIALLASGLPNNPEVKKSLVPRVLRNLIDDRLKEAEIKNGNITVTDEAVKLQIEQISRNNKKSVDEFLSAFEESGISIPAFKSQLRTELGWAQFVQQEIRPNVTVSDAEVDAEINRLKRSAGQDEYRVAEIFIDVARTDKDKDAKMLADELVEQLKSGSKFQSLARQFSNSSSAATNGDLGWVFAGSFQNDTLNEAVASMNKGMLKGPITTEEGYYILFMIDKRKATGFAQAETLANLKRIFSTDKAAIEAAMPKIKGCISMDAQLASFASDKTGNINNALMEKLPPTLLQTVKSLKIAEPSSLVEEDGGYSLYMVCQKTYKGNRNMPTRDSIYNALGQSRLEQRQRQYINNLRSNAFIDIRL